MTRGDFVVVVGGSPHNRREAVFDLLGADDTASVFSRNVADDELYYESYQLVPSIQHLCAGRVIPRTTVVLFCRSLRELEIFLDLCATLGAVYNFVVVADFDDRSTGRVLELVGPKTSKSWDMPVATQVVALDSLAQMWKDAIT